MGYRGRSGWAALGAGLSSLGALAEKSQAEARKEQLDNAERDLRLRTLKAQEMSVPGAMSLETALPALNQRAADEAGPRPPTSVVSNPGLGDLQLNSPDFRNDPTALTAESLRRIGDASDTGATIDFRAPAPITKTVDGRTISVRDNAPFLTGTGVVEDPRGAREQSMAASDLNYATTNERAQTEANRQADLLAAAGVDPARVAAIRARVPAGSVDDLFRQPSAMERMPLGLQMRQKNVDELRQRAALRRQGLKDPGILGSAEAQADYQKQLDLVHQDDEALGSAIDQLTADQEAWMAANPRGGVTPKQNDDGSGRVGMPTSSSSKPFVYAGPVGSYAMPQDLTGGQDISTSLQQPALGNISAMVNRGKVTPPATPTPTLAPPRAGVAAPPDTSSAGSPQMASANAADTSSIGPPAPVTPIPPPTAPAAAPVSVTTPSPTLNTNDSTTARATAQALKAAGKTPAEIMQIMNAAGFRVKHRGQP